LLDQHGWRASFWAAAIFSAGLIGPASAMPVPPTNSADPPQSIVTPFQQVFSTPTFAVQMLGLSAFSGSLYAWFAGSANFLLVGVKMSASGFAGVQLLASLAYAAGALVPTVWAHRWSRDVLVRWGCTSAFAGTSALLALVVADVVSPAPIIASVMVFGAGLGLVQAAGTAQVLAPFPKFAGAASSVIGATQILLGAIMAGLAGLAGTFAMAACMALCAGFGWVALRQNAAGRTDANT
jgi:DHA1 family bicyclomycin/chloramphenicol resistance-like MFS transporter